MSVLHIKIIYIYEYYPTLSVTDDYTNYILIYIFCMKKKHESKILMSRLFVDVSDKIRRS
jgi:hypothetical protein